MRTILLTVFATVALFVSGCDGDGAIGDSDALTSALASAAPGDRVCLSAGTFTGPFDVPAGVTLCGAGVGMTRIIGPSDRPTLRLMPGAAGFVTTVEEMTVEGTSDFAIIARGAGDVRIQNAEIAVPTNGAGVGFEALTSAVLSAVDIHGPVDATNADGMPLDPTIADSATYGLVAVNTGTVEATGVEVSGFAYVGVLTVMTDLEWTGGQITENLGTGLLVHGGSANLTSAALSAALQGTRLIPAYNAVFSGNANVVTNGVSVLGGGGYGILQSEATAAHSNLMAMDNANAALWVQDSGGFSLDNVIVQNNGMAGVVALASTEITLRQVDIQRTRAMTRIFGTMPVEVGDGVHLLRSTTNVELDRVTLEENTRVGVLFDLDGSDFSGIDVVSVDVTGSGEQLGAIAQNGTIPMTWDENITRSSIIQMNDSAFMGSLDTVGIVGPSDLPVDPAIISMGLAGIVGPSD